MRWSFAAACVALVLVGAIGVGCASDPATPQGGTLTINPEPNAINAPWQLDGPSGLSLTGQGDMILTNMTVGNYTIDWGSVAGWELLTSATLTQTLAANGMLTFGGTYAAATGSISIDTEPNIINAPWHVEGPNGFVADGIGDATIADLLGGSYTVSWGAVEGYLTPDAATMVLPAGGNLLFSATYVEEGLPFPGSEDQLMANFQAAYSAMDLTEYLKLMHPNYITVLQTGTTSLFPDVGASLDAEEERRIHDRMFSKQDVTDPLGNLVAGVQTIQFQTFQRVGMWATSLANDMIPNARYALYSVQFLFDRGQDNSTLKVTGNVRFYVTSRDSVVGGVPRSYYRMIGQVDLTDSSKATDAVAWGSVKALFR